MRVLIYTRVSTQGQKEGYSLESQKSACLKKAEELSAEVIYHLEDTYTGAELERPALNQLRELVQSRQIDAVICLDPDRLSRNLADLLLLTSEMDRSNVELVFVNFTWESTPLGRLFLEMRGAIAEFEHALIRERTLRGKRQKAREGRLPSFVEPYGYRFNPKDDCLNVVQREAAVVSYIFREYNRGCNSGRILAEKLNKQRIPAPSGAKWHPSTVLRILSNRTYLGVLDVGGIEIEVPKLIGEEDFAKAQEIKALNRRRSLRRTKKEYLLQNLLTCSLCGSSLKVSAHCVRGKSYSYYVCPKRRGKLCLLKPLPTEALDHLVLVEFEKRFAHAAPKFREYEKKLEKDRRERLLESKNKELGNIKHREEKLLDLLLSGVINPEVYREEKKSVERSKKVLLEDIERLGQEVPDAPYCTKVPPNLRKKALEIFTEKILVTATGEIRVYALI